MKTDGSPSKKDDKIIFANESDAGHSLKNGHTGVFKILIADDEKDIHSLTKMVLSDYRYKGAALAFYSAYSGQEAKKLIQDHPDAACILLDVVMETKDAGIEVARFIREEEKNNKLQIVLRTGQPGKAPEKQVILNYDINDYKEKTELTAQKLFTTITTALRSYSHLVALDEKNQEIALKNNRLNEEIARRIVAESNLTKYNRSLEKIIDSKSQRLQKALQELEKKENELHDVYPMAMVGDLSSAAIIRMNHSGEEIKKNIETINAYRHDMTGLLEKYENLQNILSAYYEGSHRLANDTCEALGDIDLFKKKIDLKNILEKYPEIITDARKGIQIISETVTDIKRFISIQDEPEKSCDINQLLIPIADEFKSRFPPGIDLQTEFGDIPAASITMENMKQAFREIMKNAFQAVTPHGIVSISTTYTAPDIIIQISDLGPGIAPERLEHIFKPGYTTDRMQTRGFGLAFAKSVVMTNKGTIRAASTLNEGTDIIVTLPHRKKSA